MSKETLKVTYNKSQHHNAYAATGAIGAKNPQGEIVVDLFIEKEKTYDSTIIIDHENGNVEEKKEIDTRTYIREIQCTLVLRPDIALSIGNWLIENATKQTKSNQEAQDEQNL